MKLTSCTRALIMPILIVFSVAGSIPLKAADVQSEMEEESAPFPAREVPLSRQLDSAFLTFFVQSLPSFNRWLNLTGAQVATMKTKAIALLTLALGPLPLGNVVMSPLVDGGNDPIGFTVWIVTPTETMKYYWGPGGPIEILTTTHE